MKFSKSQINIVSFFGPLLALGICTTFYFGYYAYQAKQVTDSYVHVTTEQRGYCHGLRDTFREDRRAFCYNDAIAEILSHKFLGYTMEECAHSQIFKQADYAQGKKIKERCASIIDADNMDPRDPGAKDRREKTLEKL